MFAVSVKDIEITSDQNVLVLPLGSEHRQVGDQPVYRRIRINEVALGNAVDPFPCAIHRHGDKRFAQWWHDMRRSQRPRPADSQFSTAGVGERLCVNTLDLCSV